MEEASSSAAGGSPVAACGRFVWQHDASRARAQTFQGLRFATNRLSIVVSSKITALAIRVRDITQPRVKVWVRLRSNEQTTSNH